MKYNEIKGDLKDEGNNYKQKVFIDADDVILNSSEVVLDILNKKFNITPPKKITDIKDWGYRSIYKNISKEDIHEIFSSEDFWNNIKIKKGILNILKDKELNKKYEWCIVTKGNEENLKKKFNFLSKQFSLYSALCFVEKIEFYGLEDTEHKSIINMSNGIQIDDNISYLETNAKTKILLTNYLETNYNRIETLSSQQNVYRINTLEEFKELLDFNLEAKMF